jgi:hypothetical protein
VNSLAIKCARKLSSGLKHRGSGKSMAGRSRLLRILVIQVQEYLNRAGQRARQQEQHCEGNDNDHSNSSASRPH